MAKAGLTGTVIDPADPLGDDRLVRQFTDAGYTVDDAAELAAAWGTDVRTAQVFGALLIQPG